MQITKDSHVSDVATRVPATIKVFQRHHLDFCCGGKRPLVEACEAQGLDVAELIDELRAATAAGTETRDWQAAPLRELVAYIQQRFHGPLRDELPRLSQMMDRVVQRHGDHLPTTLLPLQDALTLLQDDLLEHMAKEDAILFPAIVSLQAGRGPGAWIEQPIAVMEAEHDRAGRALARMRELTDGYTPPEWACPTFRGLYHGLSELEREMHLHVHLENHILFPRAAEIARSR